MENGRVPEALLLRGYQVRLFSFSALDKYLGLNVLPFVFAETSAGIGELARYTDELFFPGADLADAAADSGGRRWYFRCRDSFETPANPSYNMLSLVEDLRSRRFLDTLGIYPVIRSLKCSRSSAALDKPSAYPWWEDLHPKAGCLQAVFDGALILSRYEAVIYPPSVYLENLEQGIDNETFAGSQWQQALLTGLMSSFRPDRGLEFLKASGFLGKYWPEIANLDRADHSKEFHPEGNAWKHTLSTFEHRKQNNGGDYDLRLSLALLLHDIGKPLAEEIGSRRFAGHAELGARAASRFLERLDFDPGLADDVYYLVKNHMLPAALARLSPAKTGNVMDSPLFPSLMELYRCDESSSFKGLDGYYRNSAAYQTYLRNMKNPYRSADGKVLGRGHKR